MTASAEKIPVYLEASSKRTIAGAIEWPGWCRAGCDEASALEALAAYSPRYARAIQTAQPGFLPPAGPLEFEIVERLPGNATTDFGAPGAAPSADARPLAGEELRRQVDVLEACWQTLTTAAAAAEGQELRKGPRGGGRDLLGIIEHVLEAHRAYLQRLGRKPPAPSDGDLPEQVRRLLDASLEAVAASAAGELSVQGPGGGARWTSRYFVRRAAWHLLDHAWEIEDRAI